MACGIYMWTSPSGKIYIGQSKNLEHRKNEFINIKKVYTSKTSAIDFARHKYQDFSKWKYTILEECEESALNERERFYVEKYNSFVEGYNSNKGGNFDGAAVVKAGKKRAKRILQYGLDGKFIKLWGSAKEAALSLGIGERNLLVAARCFENKTCGGFQWRQLLAGEIYETKIAPVKAPKERIAEAKYKSVLQFSLDGTFLKEWACIKDAATSLKISHSHISACCKGKRPAAGNFQWKYKKDENVHINDIGCGNIRISQARRKTILQYSLAGDFIKEWESITVAEKSLKINGISSCILGKIMTAGGYQWKEKGEDFKQKIPEALPRRVRGSITRTGKKNKKTKQTISAYMR